MGKRWESLKKYSSWRKISVGMWRPPNDPSIYGYETVDVSNLLPYLDEVSRVSGTKVTISAFCVKLTAEVFKRHPDLNVVMIGKKVRQRKNIDIFCQVAVADETASEADLSGVKLTNADQMSLVEIAQRLTSRASDVRAGQDAEMEKTKSMVDIVPPWLMGGVLKMVDFLTFNVPFDLDKMGIRSDPFGSAMVTSVGPFDIRHGFAPLVPASRVPIVVLPGAVHKAPVVTEEGEVEARDAMNVCLTFDHRCYDGYQIGYFVRIMRDMLLNPTNYLPEPSHYGQPDSDGVQPPRPEDRDPEDREIEAAPAE
ncbi:MAG: 2-oxo acid dehydrogenase subunit E2 [Persicimonas sp.]